MCLLVLKSPLTTLRGYPSRITDFETSINGKMKCGKFYIFLIIQRRDLRKHNVLDIVTFDVIIEITFWMPTLA